MTSTTKNDLLDKLDTEPVRKRARLNRDSDNNVCIHLQKLMSYDENETTTINKLPQSITSASNETDGGDSGFQEFSSNDSPSTTNSSTSNNNQQENEEKSNFSLQDNENIFTSFPKLNGVFIQNQNGDLVNLLNLYNLENEDDNEDDNESIISDISSLSDLEDTKKWQSNFGALSWVQQQITSGHNPREILDEILPDNSISNHVNDITLWRILFDILSEPPKRRKLVEYNSLQDVVNLIKKSKKIIILTGAGISVSSGIPDFRSKNGIYARLSVDFPDLPDPQAMFDINYFKKDQRPFFKFAKEIYPGQFIPSISHKFIKLIEKHGKLLRNYTQNIDTLEKSANIERVITCHGSFETARCTECRYKVDSSFIKNEIFSQKIPRCPKCPEDSEELCIMKPDIVFFGESLPKKFHDSMALDKNECDLLIVIGSSLKVKPVALIPSSIPPEVPQILINKENLSHMTFDVELLGDCDVIVQELCHRLGEGWSEMCVNNKLTEIKDFNHLRNLSKNKINETSQTEESNSEIPCTSKDVIDDKISLLKHLPNDSYLFCSPNRYLFKGAEIYSDNEDDSGDEDDKEDLATNITETIAKKIVNKKKVHDLYHELDDYEVNVTENQIFKNNL